MTDVAPPTRSDLGLEPPFLRTPPDTAVPGDALVTQREAQDILGLRPGSLRKALQAGLLDGVPAGRQHLITLASIAACQANPACLDPILDDELLAPRRAATLLGLHTRDLVLLERDGWLNPDQVVHGKPRYRRGTVRQLAAARPDLLASIREGEYQRRAPAAGIDMADLAAVSVAPRRPETFTLDRFQVEAEEMLERGYHVLVAAPTGAGKSLIAERLIQRAMDRGEGIIYTGPIKALINQKFRDLYRLYGDRVGIITGDVVIRDTAQVLVVTTEIFRNMAVGRPQSLERYSCLVLDEVHYLDSDRGATWEESIIFKPPHMQILALSATVANAGEIAAWIEAVTAHTTRVIHEQRRPVPLAIHYVGPSVRPLRFAEALAEWGQWRKETGSQHGRSGRPAHWRVIEMVARRRWLPCLYFIFSRAGCEDKARDLAVAYDFLTAAERERVEAHLAARGTADMAHSPSYRALRESLIRGVGFHHAGMLPQAKEMVEELYEMGLVKVLYCTETFAVGVNFPVKCACFDGVRKFGGEDFRPLTVLEFHQMSGRAGRRGIDPEGHAVVVLGPGDLDDVRDYAQTRPEPVISRLSLRPNTVLNLLAGRGDEEIRALLTQSLKVFQAQRGARERREAAEKLRQALTELMCPQAGTMACPILRRPVAKRVAALQEQLSTLRGNRRPRERRIKRRVAEELQALEAQLAAEADRGCPEAVVEACRDIYPEWEKATAAVRAARKHERRGERTAAELIQQFERIRDQLVALDYVADGQLLPRGQFAREVHVEEICVTELYFSGFFHRAGEEEICAILTCLAFDGKEIESSLPRRPWSTLRLALEVIRAYAQNFHRGIFFPALRWAQGRDFGALLADFPLAEGDLVSALRRGMDLTRQVRRAVEEPGIRDKLGRCLARLDRPPVRVDLE